jgi:hypothetical protein
MAIAQVSQVVEEYHNGDYLDYALWVTVREVEATMAGGSCYPVLELEKGTHGDLSKVRTSWTFPSLLGAMYLQMHWLIAAGGRVIRCRYCGRVISLTSPLPGARKPSWKATSPAVTFTPLTC